MRPAATRPESASHRQHKSDSFFQSTDRNFNVSFDDQFQTIHSQDALRKGKAKLSSSPAHVGGSQKYSEFTGRESQHMSSNRSHKYYEIKLHYLDLMPQAD
jgi:hypothetical protein